MQKLFDSTHLEEVDDDDGDNGSRAAIAWMGSKRRSWDGFLLVQLNTTLNLSR